MKKLNDAKKFKRDPYFEPKEDDSDNARIIAHNDARMHSLTLEEKDTSSKVSYTARIPDELHERINDAIYALKKKYKVSRDTLAVEAYNDLLEKYKKNGLI